MDKYVNTAVILELIHMKYKQEYTYTLHITNNKNNSDIIIFFSMNLI